MTACPRMIGRALVKFLTQSQGGRKSPPVHMPGQWFYRPQAVFEGQQDEPGHPYGQFGIGMRFGGPADENLVMHAEIQWAVDGAPHHLIVPGAKFKVYEGSKLVANGEVLESHPAG